MIMWGFGRGSTITQLVQSYTILYYPILSYTILPHITIRICLCMAEHLVLRSPLYRSSTAYILQPISPTINLMPISSLKSRPHD
jgi:hypothetical protein